MTRIWDKFEYKAVVCFTGYKDRYASLLSEFERVGLTNVHPHWDFPNPYHQVLLNVVPMSKFNRNRSCFFIGLNNYRAIATAYHLGCENCLIMEDDIRFLRDTNLLSDIIDSLPRDFDLALLDYGKPCSMTENEWKNIFAKEVCPHWCRFQNLRSTGCYAMSRRCMEAYLKTFEAPTQVGNGILRNPDWYFNEMYLGKDKNLYAAKPAAALQASFQTMHCKTLEEYYHLHEKIGMPIDRYNLHSLYDGIVDYKLYNCPDGYPTNIRIL